MDNVIEKIINGTDLEIIINEVRKKIFLNGPRNIEDLEILSCLKYYQPEFFKEYEGDILERMGVFYKDNEIDTIEALLMSNYKDVIFEKYNKNYTPLQTNLMSEILLNKNFSFSAPTSTGKSYILRDIIQDEKDGDMVIIVPSRALINEYLIKIRNIIKDKTVNVLTSVEIINKKNRKRNIFILTPERAKELFKNKDELNIRMILFDEAQLGDEESTRGIWFDSIVRRIKEKFPETKMLFSHPFIENPEAQLKKNDIREGKSKNYEERNVGQMFISHDKGIFYNFGINKEVMGNKCIVMKNDPVEDIIRNKGTVLIYTSKSSIYNEETFAKFSKYINLCEEIKEKEALKLIKKLKELIGATQRKNSKKFSKMISMLKKGIITHHGSLPLKARLILEEFVQKNFCRICFSTSTLVQGINMPFDVVWIDKFEKSQPLNVLNLIGRAGRSTLEKKFDYGMVIISNNNRKKLMDVISNRIKLKEISMLDIEDTQDDENVKEFKEAVKTGALIDEYNLAPKQIKRLENTELEENIIFLLDKLMENDTFIDEKIFRNYEEKTVNKIKECFQKIYIKYLNREELSRGEKSVLSTALRILIWQINGKTFKQIVWYRYSYITKSEERKSLIQKLGIINAQEKIDNMEPRFTMECSDIPNKNLPSFSMFNNQKIKDINYDRIVFDTYDYIDKIIGFKLKDIYYATFQKYYERTNDIRAKNMALYFKYGTIDGKEIMLIRYGFSFETIEWLKKYVKRIDENEIVFDNRVKFLSKDKLKEVEYYF